MTTFATTQDVIDQHVAPALGRGTSEDHTAEFDMAAIAQAITTWQDGRLVIDEDVDFWGIAAQHEIN